MGDRRRRPNRVTGTEPQSAHRNDLDLHITLLTPTDTRHGVPSCEPRNRHDDQDPTVRNSTTLLLVGLLLALVAATAYQLLSATNL